MFAVQGGRDIAFLHAADDLDFLYDFAVAQDLKAGPLNHQIIQVFFEKVPDAYFRDEFGFGIFLRVICIEALFIFYEYAGARAGEISKQQRANIGAVHGYASVPGWQSE